MRKIIISTMAAMTLLSSVAAVASATANVSLNGKSVHFDVAPIFQNDRTYVPFRAIFEQLGATVSWDEINQQAIASKNGLGIIVPLNDTNIYVGKFHLKMDVKPITVNGRVLVPLRYVSQALGANVNWIAEANQVDLTLSYRSMVDQLASGYDKNLSYEQAAVLFEWLIIGDTTGELPSFNADKPPVVNPFTGKGEYRYSPSLIRAKGVVEWQKDLWATTKPKWVNQTVNREVWSDKFRITELTIETDNGYKTTALGVFDQTKGEFFKGEGVDVAAYLPKQQ